MVADWTLLLILLVALGTQRLLEVLRARRNTAALLRRGGRLVGGDAYGPIVALHASFFVACAVEFAVSPFAGVSTWTVPLLLVFLAGQLLRRWAMHALRERWTTRVVVLPGEPPVRSGPYRFLRHPNYVGVALELAALPLAFGLVGTALLWSAANALLLRRRISVEERALREAAA